MRIMSEHCRSLDRCTLDDLIEFERELTGEVHRWLPMQSAYNTMIRTDSNSYVAEKYVNFDAIEIDSAIEHFMNSDEYLPLKDVVIFAHFPHCGQAWNLFLLESYCRRFSNKFRFECLSVNSKNAGAIVRKHSRLTYFDVMVDAVAKSGIELRDKAILDFLVGKGYTSTKRFAKVTELIRQANGLRRKAVK